MLNNRTRLIRSAQEGAGTNPWLKNTWNNAKAGTAGLFAQNSQTGMMAGNALGGIGNQMQLQQADGNNKNLQMVGNVLNQTANNTLVGGAAHLGQTAIINSRFGKTDEFGNERKIVGNGMNAINATGDGLITVGSKIGGPWGYALQGVGAGVELAGGLTAQSLDSFGINQDVQNSSAYTGTADLAANSNAGGVVSLFDNKNKFNKKIQEAKQQQELAAQNLNQAKDFKTLQEQYALNFVAPGLNQMGQTTGQAFMIKRGSKLKNTYDRAKLLTRKAQQGIKIERKITPIEEVIEEVWEEPDPELVIEDISDIRIFQQGGKMNVIPEGALHKEKHSIDIEEVTKKGIPVVSIEDGDIEQHAEIERNEIIFTKDVTTQLEKWWNLFNNEKDPNIARSYAVEAGKLLSTEIIENTDDRTGLIEAV